MKKTLLFLLGIITFSATSQSLVLDESFAIGSGPNGIVYAIEPMADGKIIVAGHFTEYNGNTASSIVRLNADGSYDESFSAQNLGEQFGDVVIEDDGKVVIGGMFGFLTRVNSDGSADESFTPPSISSPDFMFISKQGSKYIVSGSFNYINSEGQMYKNIIRLNYDGSVDTTFPPLELYGNFAKTLVLDDNRIIAYGGITHYNTTEVSNIIRLTADGTLDDSFNNEGLVISGNVNALAVQSDGKYVFSGSFANVNGTERNMIARIDENGSLDETFVPAGGDTVRGMSISIQENGKIITGGYFYDSFIDLDAPFDDSIIIYTQRYNTDGSVDTSYNITQGFNQPVFALANQEDGKVIAGGWFTEFEGEEQNYIARFNNTVLSVQDNKQNLLSVYPNPVSERLFIDSDESISQNASVSLFDITGKQLYSVDINRINNFGLDMSGYTAGMYLLKITDGEKSFNHKIIKN